FRALTRVALEAGENHVSVAVPWNDAELISYPTGFGKALANRQFNQYHWIHVDTLGKIVEETGSEILAYYREKWLRYPQDWPGMPQYQDERITLARFDPPKHKEVYRSSSPRSPPRRPRTRRGPPPGGAAPP